MSGDFENLFPYLPPYHMNFCIYKFEVLQQSSSYCCGELIYCCKGLSWSWSYGCWIYNYLWNRCLLPLTLRVTIPLRWGVLNTALCDKVCQWLVAGRGVSQGTPVSSTNKTDLNDITEILLKVALNTINQTYSFVLLFNF